MKKQIKLLKKKGRRGMQDDREGDTHPMDLDVPGTSTTSVGDETMSSI
jgi:hypothetical protein